MNENFNEIEKIFLSCIDEAKNSIAFLKEFFENRNLEWLHSTIRYMIECRNSGGYVIFSGIGKSGYIAQKLSATMASLGFPSFYLHPSEASHGDLGRITSKSILVILSKSGESKELQDLVLYCRKNRVPMISMTSNSKSFLAMHSDVVIPLQMNSEFCHMNVSPTTSTLLCLLLGDAISVTASRMIGFDRESFRNFHPGGKLGTQLVRVFEIMTSLSSTAYVDSHENLKNVILRMTTMRQNLCVVVKNSKEENPVVEGIVTDFDLRKVLSLENVDINRKKVKDIMNTEFFFVNPDSFASDVLKIMTRKRYNVAPVIEIVDNRKILKGVLHISKLIEIGLEI